MEEIKKIPEIRFGGFENEWIKSKTEALCLISTGDSNTQDRIAEGKYPFYVRSATIEKSNRYLFDEEAVLTIGDGVGTGKVYHYVNGKYDLHQRVYRMFNFENIYAKYFYYYFSENFGKRVLAMTAKSSVDSVRKEMIEKMDVLYPETLDEQKLISNVFQNLDNSIKNHNTQLKKLTNLKKAMLIKMFPQDGAAVPEIRFKGFDGEWVEESLNDLANIVRGASPRPIKDPKWFDKSSEIGWLRISDVTAQDGKIKYLSQRISEAGQEKTRVLQTQHLLLSIAASVGKPVLNYVKTGVHDGFLIFLDPEFELNFMFHWLKMFEPKWQIYGQPGSQVNLNSDIVKNHKVFIPCKSEQKQIGDFFDNTDRQIENHKEQLKKLNQIKKACLSKLFVSQD